MCVSPCHYPPPLRRAGAGAGPLSDAEGPRATVGDESLQDLLIPGGKVGQGPLERVLQVAGVPGAHGLPVVGVVVAVPRRDGFGVLGRNLVFADPVPVLLRGFRSQRLPAVAFGKRENLSPPLKAPVEVPSECVQVHAHDCKRKTPGSPGAKCGGIVGLLPLGQQRICQLPEHLIACRLLFRGGVVAEHRFRRHVERGRRPLGVSCRAVCPANKLLRLAHFPDHLVPCTAQQADHDFEPDSVCRPRQHQALVDRLFQRG